MKWGRKKALSSSSPRPSLISSWLFKFKKMGSGSSSSEQKLDRGKHKGRLNSTGSTSSQPYTGDKGGRFYEEDGDAFWRISFEEEGVNGRSTSKGVVRSPWDKQDEPQRICQSCRSNSIIAKGSEETLKFSSMVSNARKIREFLSDEARLLPKLNTSCRRKAEEKLDKSRRVARKDCGLITQDRRCPEDKLFGSLRTIRTSIHHSRMHNDDTSSKSSEHCNVETSENSRVLSCMNVDKWDGVYNGDVSPDWQELKQTKFAEFKAKTEKQRKSVYMSREPQMNKPKQCSKVRVFSPRTIARIENCKIKALEDIKKANRLKMKRKIRERMVGGKSNLENFAIVKCSYKPEKDFRDSMIEMIVEKRMHQPEELEELLACYLTLNSDEYHDLIIKVFKEAWFQLNQEGLVAEF